MAFINRNRPAVRAAVTLAATVILGCTFSDHARADVFGTFNLAWSGAPGDAASATGQIVLDLTTIPNPGGYSDASAMPSWVQSVTVTVSGASAGNGTFTTGDFRGMYWDTAGATLDFSKDLVGQPADGATWGAPTSVGDTGDFNLFFSTPSAPTGVTPFTLAADGGSSDAMSLTAFTPVPEPVPAPSSLSVLGVGLLGLAGMAAIRRSRMPS